MRAINKQILQNIIKNAKDTSVNMVATDKGLAQLLGVTRQTVHAWRNAGLIPYKVVEAGKLVRIYNPQKVVVALLKHSGETLAHAIDIQELQDKIDEL